MSRDTMLKTMFSTNVGVRKDSDGTYYCPLYGCFPVSCVLSEFNQRLIFSGFIRIDRSGKHFACILNWLRDGDIPLPNLAAEIEELYHEAKYYLCEVNFSIFLRLGNTLRAILISLILRWTTRLLSEEFVWLIGQWVDWLIDWLVNKWIYYSSHVFDLWDFYSSLIPGFNTQMWSSTPSTQRPFVPGSTDNFGPRGATTDFQRQEARSEIAS